MSGHTKWRDMPRHRDSEWRCPTHGRVLPVEGEDPPRCRIKFRRSIAGEAVEGRCDERLEHVDEG